MCPVLTVVLTDFADLFGLVLEPASEVSIGVPQACKVTQRGCSHVGVVVLTEIVHMGTVFVLDVLMTAAFTQTYGGLRLVHS